MWDGLDRLAIMPDWLNQLDDVALVRSALLEALPDARDARLARVRLKAEAWTAECTIDPGGLDDTVSVTARILPPSSGRPLPEPRSGTRPGAEGWRCPVPRLNLELVSGAPPDEGLPALAALTDPVRARALLETSIRAGAPRYRDLRIKAVTPQVMRYSPGSRCTVLFRLEFPPVPGAAEWPDVVVAKTYRLADKGQTAWDGMRALWDSSFARSEDVSIAEPLAWLPVEKVLVQGPVGQDATLKELMLTTLARGRSTRELDTYVGMAATGLAQLHTCGVTTGRMATWEGELAEVREGLGQLASVVPELTGAADAYLAHLVQLAGHVPPDPPGPAHRSFRPAQVLTHHGRIGFIDFDGFCQAEPALDVALFRATVRDLAMSALPSVDPLDDRLGTIDGLCDHFLDRYGALAPVSRERVALWESLDLLTNVMHAWTKVKPARLTRAFALLRHHVAVQGTDQLPGGLTTVPLPQESP